MPVYEADGVGEVHEQTRVLNDKAGEKTKMPDLSLLQKLQSTKLGVLGGIAALLYQMDASPWCLVAVAIGYFAANAAQSILRKK